MIQYGCIRKDQEGTICKWLPFMTFHAGNRMPPQANTNCLDFLAHTRIYNVPFDDDMMMLN